MFQSNFLNEFGTLSPKKPKKSKTIRALESLWLDVFVNLSFCTEGQNMILKIQGSSLKRAGRNGRFEVPLYVSMYM